MLDFRLTTNLKSYLLLSQQRCADDSGIIAENRLADFSLLLGMLAVSFFFNIFSDRVKKVIALVADSAADAKFHRYLAECSGNHVLPNLIPIIASAIGVVITVTNDEHRSQSGMEHQRIVDAIRRHDPEGAKYSMIAHLNTSRNSMVHSRDNCAAKR